MTTTKNLEKIMKSTNTRANTRSINQEETMPSPYKIILGLYTLGANQIKYESVKGLQIDRNNYHYGELGYN